MPFVESCRLFSQPRRVPAVSLRLGVGFSRSKQLTSAFPFFYFTNFRTDLTAWLKMADRPAQPVVTTSSIATLQRLQAMLRSARPRPNLSRPSEDGQQVHCRGIVVKTVSKMSNGEGFASFAYACPVRKLTIERAAYVADIAASRPAVDLMAAGEVASLSAPR